MDWIVVQHFLEIERQRNESNTLRGKGSNRRHGGQRKHRPAQQVDRQHRRCVTGLAQ